MLFQFLVTKAANAALSVTKCSNDPEQNHASVRALHNSEEKEGGVTSTNKSQRRQPGRRDGGRLPGWDREGGPNCSSPIPPAPKPRRMASPLSASSVAGTAWGSRLACQALHHHLPRRHVAEVGRGGDSRGGLS